MTADDDHGVPGEAAALFLGRLLIAAIYLNGGFDKLTGIDGFAGYLSNHGILTGAYPLAVLAAVVEFFGALCLLLGFQTRYVALLMALFTLVAALIGHRFWDETEAAAIRNQTIHFMKNVAIIGGFLFLYVCGPGPWSVDRGGR